jgi:hypothetical protein
MDWMTTNVIPWKDKSRKYELGTYVGIVENRVGLS